MNDGYSERNEFQSPVEQKPSIDSVLKASYKTVKSRLGKLVSSTKRGIVQKIILGTPLAALLLSSGNIDNPDIHASNIKEPTPASAPLTPASRTNETPTLEDQNTMVREFINGIESKYGIDVRVKFIDIHADFMDPETISSLEEFNSSTKPKIPFPKKEAVVLEKAISAIPFCSKITDQLAIIKMPQKEDPGNDWAYMGGSMNPKTSEEESSRIAIFLPEGTDLDSLTMEYHKLGIDTYADMLKQIFFHECGHRISDKILSSLYPAEEYFRMVDPNNVYRYNIQEKKNPLLIPFAKLEGWRLDQEFLHKRDLVSSYM